MADFEGVMEVAEEKPKDEQNKKKWKRKGRRCDNEHTEIEDIRKRCSEEVSEGLPLSVLKQTCEIWGLNY